MRYGNYKIRWNHNVKKGTTECFIYDLNGDLLSYSMVRKYAKAEYVKEKARRYSLERALQLGSFNKEDRTEIWHDYNERAKNRNEVTVTVEQDGKTVKFKIKPDTREGAPQDGLMVELHGLGSFTKGNNSPLLATLLINKLGQDWGLFKQQANVQNVKQAESPVTNQEK